jgi:ABC-type transporter Mla MlaB component
MPVMWLRGALDQATVTLLDHELDGRAIGLLGLVVDLTGLTFIDSAGLDVLVRMHWRSSTRGEQLTFRHGPQVAQWPVELTRSVRQRSRRMAHGAGVRGEKSAFALAMTRVDVDVDVDVDHPPSDDRPEAA